jgi:hypothetical protein
VLTNHALQFDDFDDKKLNNFVCPSAEVCHLAFSAHMKPPMINAE